MDLFITLRDGRTVPMTGVSAVRSVDTYGTATSFPASAITNTSTDVTVSSTSGIRPGASVFGSGIPTGATVTAITSATVFVMSAAATATIGSLTLTITAVTDADMKLLKIDSGWYRDIFTSSITSAQSTFNVGKVVDTTGGATYQGPGIATVVNSNSPNANGPVTASVTISQESDEVAHVDLRQATWLESLWAFECTVLTDTLTLYYRKYDVVGFCNVAPSL